MRGEFLPCEIGNHPTTGEIKRAATEQNEVIRGRVVAMAHKRTEAGVSSPTLEELRALDPADPLTLARIAALLVRLDRRMVGDDELEAIHAEVRRLRREIKALPARDAAPPARRRRRDYGVED